MAPFTPFMTEGMYQNLARCLPASAKAPPSVHFCDFPSVQPAQPGDERIQQSVDRMTVRATGRGALVAYKLHTRLHAG